MSGRGRVANARLGGLLAEAGWSGAELARAVNALGTLHGLPLRYDRTAVAHWLSGTRPRRPVPELIAAALTERCGRLVTVAEAGLDPAPAKPGPGSAMAADGAGELLRLALQARADLDPHSRPPLLRSPYQPTPVPTPTWDPPGPKAADADTDPPAPAAHAGAAAGTRTRPGTPPGVGAAAGAGTGPGTPPGTGPAAGTGTGPGTPSGAGSAAGAGPAPGAPPGVGAAAGAGTGPGTPSGAGSAAGAGTGPGTPSGTGAAAGPAPGAPPGTGAAAGTGTGLGAPPGTGTAPGTGIAPGTGAATGAGAVPDSATGAGAATGRGSHRAGAVPGTGAAPGTGIAPGTGAATVKGAVTGRGSGTRAGAVLGTGIAPGRGAGTGRGAATGEGVGSGIASGTGMATGGGAATGRGTGVGAGAAAGRGMAPGRGAARGAVTSTGAGTSSRTAPGTGTDAATSSGPAPGTGIAELAARRHLAAHAEQLRALAGSFSGLYLTHGGVHTRTALAAWLAQDAGAFAARHADGPGAVGRGVADVWRGYAQLAHLLAEMTADAGYHGLAQEYHGIALGLARQAGDRRMYAITLRAMSAHAGRLGQPAHAVRLARTAVETAPADGEPGTLAFLLVQRAAAHAHAGQREAATADLAAADRLHGRHALKPPDGPFDSYGRADLDFARARTHLALGEFPAAAEALERSLRGRAAGQHRATALTHAALAETLLRLGHLTRACEHWRAFLTAAPAVQSRAVREALGRLLRDLTPYRRTREAVPTLAMARALAERLP
ncbi:hypothetical protein ACFRNK_06435 [Streptomyces sp. NPDC056756]|uniref:hypothetical protein n=1 Tax=Streptomyces sp. NPDC056756 TaxID=3345938 RepID=UPI0036896C29